jgi:hypothetical protein
MASLVSGLGYLQEQLKFYSCSKGVEIAAFIFICVEMSCGKFSMNSANHLEKPKI